MASPWAMLVVVIAYLGVSFAGPRCMKDRSPVDVTLFMKGYNLTLALVSAYMAREVSPNNSQPNINKDQRQIKDHLIFEWRPCRNYLRINVFVYPKHF